MNKLEEVSEELKELEEQSATLRNKIYVLTGEKSKLSQEKCKKDIGRCFKKLGETSTTYIKIIGVGEIEWNLRGDCFNEYQRPSIQFKHPYDNSKFPFVDDDVHSSILGKEHSHSKDSDYIEISNKEFAKAFNEVNTEWIKNISNI